MSVIYFKLAELLLLCSANLQVLDKTCTRLRHLLINPFCEYTKHGKWTEKDRDLIRLRVFVVGSNEFL